MCDLREVWSHTQQEPRYLVGASALRALGQGVTQPSGTRSKAFPSLSWIYSTKVEGVVFYGTRYPAGQVLGKELGCGIQEARVSPFAVPLWACFIPVGGKPTGAICKCQMKAITAVTADTRAGGDPGRLPRGGIGFGHDELSGRREE